jgi:hypothetical protein
VRKHTTHVKNVSLLLMHGHLSTGRHLVEVSFITRLKSNLCKALTTNNTTGSTFVSSHAHNTTALQSNVFLSVITLVAVTNVCRDSAVGTAFRYGLDGPGKEFRRGREFPHPSRSALVPTQPPVQLVPGLSQGKADGASR